MPPSHRDMLSSGVDEVEQTVLSMAFFRKALAVSLAAVGLLCFSPAANAGLSELQYKSAIDGSMQKCWFVAPVLKDKREPATLVVYSHGMTTSYQEPFTVGLKQPMASSVASAHPTFGFLSIGTAYSWANDGVIQDMTDMIRQAVKQYPVERIILMGTSMGGFTVLNYAEKAPEDIKAKITGVLAIYPAGDLGKLYDCTQSPDVKKSLKGILNSTPDRKALIQSRNFFPHIDEMPEGVKVAILSAVDDKFVPPKLQKDIVRACKSHKIPVKLIEVPGDHGTMPSPGRIITGLDFVVYKGMK